jgi:hypothetical protein
VRCGFERAQIKSYGLCRGGDLVEGAAVGQTDFSKRHDGHRSSRCSEVVTNVSSENRVQA